ncbi:hypothetical protein AtNW77_Chr4g0301101 [Arabidopsis thaliana]|uniref:Transmembrane protein n=1 Tax=Arabidopsis thaliana TaxID=3702 RepID=A0A178UUE5_ARATH|nr:hypothetical protein AXX17_AT4G27830 [Arabidopsis thaliana]CAA0396311.1 unnamed protein product [Arabidopsis thaliana]
MRSGGESERTVMGLVVVVVFVVVRGGEIDAGAAFEGGEESGYYGCADPASGVVDLFHGSRRANVGGDADAFVHGFWIRLAFQKTTKKRRSWDGSIYYRNNDFEPRKCKYKYIKRLLFVRNSASGVVVS